MLQESSEELVALEGMLPWPCCGGLLGQVVNLPGRCVEPHPPEGDGGAQQIPGEALDRGRISGRYSHRVVRREPRVSPREQSSIRSSVKSSSSRSRVMTRWRNSCSAVASTKGTEVKEPSVAHPPGRRWRARGGASRACRRGSVPPKPSPVETRDHRLPSPSGRAPPPRRRGTTHRAARGGGERPRAASSAS